MSEVVKKPLKITETVLRDAHQSLIATRMTTEQMLPIVDKMDKVGYNAVECWGGATFDASLRFLKEDPWERLRKLRDGFKNTKLQMLFRGQNILGYNHYADDVVEYFVQKSIANGIDIIRIFDCFKLSYLQTDWLLITWISFFLAVMAFWWVFEVLTRLYDGWSAADMGSVYKYYSSADSPLQANRILISMAVITLVSILAFAFEAWRLGFVPMFSYGVPHAYSYFHIKGIHYFTVSCVLVPSLSVVYCLMMARRGRGLVRYKGFWLAVICDIVAVMIPLFCVSRFQLILAVGMAVFTYISMTGSFSLVYVGVLFVALIPAYVALTVLRSHSVEYLNGIFEMKNSHMPIFITQPYMYIANNYDNFNCMAAELKHFSFGLKGLFPLWALTGLKFIFPSLADFPLFVTKEELTTVTLFYDAFYDFGVVGMVFFGGLLGGVCYLLGRFRRKLTCPAGHVIYAQIAMYMMLSFFTTWFSNPTTWFYLIVSGIVYVYVNS